MAAVLINLVLVVAIAAAGAAVGWWLRGGSGRPPSQNGAEELQHAREVLARLHELAASVAADVGEHSSRVEQINEELTAAEAGEAEAVVSAIDKLIQANGRMQQQLASAEERLEEQQRQIESHATEARTDALTRLANRRAFDDEIARRFADFQQYGRSLSVIMVDVDHFKRFNDTHGHQAGDAVLRGVAGVLRKNTHQTGLAARYGGEEFAVIVSGADEADVTADAEKARRAIDAVRFRFAGEELHVTASLGVAHLMLGEDAAAVIERADAALYASKEAGRNCTHWHDGKEIRRVCAQGESARRPPPTQSVQEQPVPAETADTAADRQDQMCDRNTFCALLNNRLAEWRRGGVAPSIIFVQIDNYQAILSSRGRQVADRVLHTTTQFLNAAVRDMDLVAHYDTAAFAIMLPGAAQVNMIGVAERLRQAIARCTLPLDGGELRFTVSMGGAEANREDDTPRLLRRAREALLAAVKSGGNCGYFHNGQWCEIARAALERVKSD